MTRIKFGTDGWRGIIGKEFTLSNVKVVSQSIADYIRAHGLRNNGVVVGYDTRKLSHQFADGVCEVMLGNGIPTYVTERDVPTPVAAFEVFYRKAGGAVMITASHNPPEWNGIKYIPEFAGPALPETTEEITENISRVLQAKKVNETSIESGVQTRLLKTVDPTTSYVEFVRKQIDLEALKKARLKVVFDAMHGTARGYLDSILQSVGCDVIVIHDKVDPDFGGARPEPLPELLGELKDKVVDLNADLGLATDGDADRLAVYDSNGTYLAADQLLPLLFEYSIKSGKRGGVVRTVATTRLLDRIAEKHGLPVYEVPVGFKYVGQYLREKDVVIGGEESGGISFKGHIPDKDGIFTGVKIAELRAETGRTISELLGELESEYGPMINGRNDIQCPEELKQVVMEKLSKEVPDKIIGIPISRVNKIDGLNLVLKDGGWLLIRPSGTEPVVRIYAESTDKEKLKSILEQGKNLVKKTLDETRKI
jgi:alpha-D-glucose phosphate-specific phosphoglucomutase